MENLSRGYFGVHMRHICVFIVVWSKGVVCMLYVAILIKRKNRFVFMDSLLFLNLVIVFELGYG